MSKCTKCQQVRINGLVCHELGCPDSWKDSYVKCRNCGKNFHPKEPTQDCCTKNCKKEYWG